MRFNVLSVATFAAVFAAPSVVRAICLQHGGCTTCESAQTMRSGADSFCSSFFDFQGNATMPHAAMLIGPNDQARAILRGQYASQADCFDAFTSIIDSCHGTKDGGQLDYRKAEFAATLQVAFCNCV
ncbi:hypothetical protein C2E23DRAFT_466706 [Lenzites betulinus]|nr:hypothetical protein C2E23DRAFT_466706 [Lenzites betulinus]